MTTSPTTSQRQNCASEVSTFFQAVIIGIELDEIYAKTREFLDHTRRCDTLVSNFRELRDPTVPGRSGFLIDMPDGTTRKFWSDAKMNDPD